MAQQHTSLPIIARRTGVHSWLQAPEDAAKGRAPIAQVHLCSMPVLLMACGDVGDVLRLQEL